MLCDEMALIIPSGSSPLRTYADATRTEGGRLAKYVMAQFRSDSELEWVRELRAQLVTNELKWTAVKESRSALRSKHPLLWQRVERGVGQATVIVIDVAPADGEVREFLRNLKSEPEYEGELQHHTAVALVAGTPVAHLPYELDRTFTYSNYEPLTNLEKFTPENILLKLGGAAKNAIVSKATVFAARAHAVFDLAADRLDVASTRDVFRSPLSQLVLSELLATQRFFDTELPASLDVLNDAAEEIALNLEKTMPGFAPGLERPLMHELSSRDADELQAADVAAGWARELLDLDPSVRRLAGMFERVLLNGRVLKSRADLG